MLQAVSIVLILGGVYLILLGTGRNLKPARLRGNSETAVAGRFIAFLGILLLPTFLGFTMSDIRGWLQDIWTTGGGVGTG